MSVFGVGCRVLITAVNSKLEDWEGDGERSGINVSKFVPVGHGERAAP